MDNMYTIPKHIKDDIPDEFYPMMLKELTDIFGDIILNRYCGYFDLQSSTVGWGKALNSTCKSLDMMWLIKYYEELPWYDSDLFDGEIEEEIIQKCIINGKPV